MNKSQIKFCVINTLIALVLFFLLQKSHVLPGEKNKLLFFGPILKNLVIAEVPEINKDSFLIINTSYDRMLVTHYKDLGSKSISDTEPRGNIAILDREKLTKFINKINRNPNYNYLICNIIFDHPSLFDSILGSSMQKTKNMLIAQGESLQKIRPEFKDLDIGLDMIYTPSGTFSKYRLFEKQRGIVSKSIPLKMYEKRHNTHIDPGYFFSTLNGNLIFNDYIPENKIKEADGLAPIDLGEFLELPDSFLYNLTKGKIIVLGDYYTNPKKTIYENKVPASLILVNAFLSLEQGRNTISFGLIFSLMLIFLFFSYLVIAPQSKMQSRVFRIPLLGGLLGGARYIIAMAVISLLIYFVFGNNLNLIYMGVFFYLENLVINRHFHFLRLKRRFSLTREKK